MLPSPLHQGPGHRRRPSEARHTAPSPPRPRLPPASPRIARRPAGSGKLAWRALRGKSRRVAAATAACRSGASARHAARASTAGRKWRRWAGSAKTASDVRAPPDTCSRVPRGQPRPPLDLRNPRKSTAPPAGRQRERARGPGGLRLRTARVPPPHLGLHASPLWATRKWQRFASHPRLGGHSAAARRSCFQGTSCSHLLRPRSEAGTTLQRALCLRLLPSYPILHAGVVHTEPQWTHSCVLMSSSPLSSSSSLSLSFLFPVTKAFWEWCVAITTNPGRLLASTAFLFFFIIL